MPARVKCEGHTPDPIVGVEAQLLHLGVPRTFQRVHSRTTGGGTEALNDLRLREQLILHRRRQHIEFRLELLGELHDPVHCMNMSYKPYGVKSIFIFMHQNEQLLVGSECRWKPNSASSPSTLTPRPD